MLLALTSQDRGLMSTVTSASLNHDLSFLDQEEIQQRYLVDGESCQIRFNIHGIKCANCLKKIEGLSGRLNGIESLRVHIGENVVHVSIDPKKISFSKVAEEIQRLGYGVEPIEKGFTDQELRQKRERLELIRLGVGAACAGNIMSFAFAVYFGGQGEWQKLFGWLSFILYLPVVTFVAWPFYQGAWYGFKNRQLSIDLPMTIASIAGFLFSTVELWRGKDDLYFDSMSSFLVMILMARWFQRRMQNQFQRLSQTQSTVQKVLKKTTDGLWSWALVENLSNQDEIKIRTGDVFTFDALLKDQPALVSLAWISGEMKPRIFHPGAIIPAGSKLLSGEVITQMHQSFAKSDFGQLMSRVQDYNLNRLPVMMKSDRWAQWLLWIVMSLALVFLGLYWSVSPEEAIRRSLALIVLACPCAMAFGTPLVLSFSLAKARNRGLLISDPSIFERMNQVDTVFFDKTGTLTQSELKLRDSGFDVPHVYQKIILALENTSFHPIAFAFRNAFLIKDKLPPVDGVREIPGQGVFGDIYGKSYALVKRNTGVNHQESLSCVLKEDEKVLFEFHFESELKPGAIESLKRLRAQGLKVQLLSGDHSIEVHHLGQRLGFRPEEIFAGLTPEQKAEIVTQHPHSMMVGDGINDSLALMKAYVGVAASGALGVALQSSQVYLLKEDLSSIVDLFESSSRALKAIHTNLMLSVFYNVLGGSAALLGFVNPYVAAVLMPISSGLILLHSWWRGSR